MNFNEFLGRTNDINLSLDQKKRLYDIIINNNKDINNAIKDINNTISNINNSLIDEDRVLQLIKNNQSPIKQFIIRGLCYANERLNGYFLDANNIIYINIDDIEYNFNLNSIVSNHTDENYFNSEYYHLGDIELYGTTYYNYYPLLFCINYNLGKLNGFTVNVSDSRYISDYFPRINATKTFKIYNENTSTLEDTKVNVIYDGDYFIITDGDNPNLYNCGVYILNPKFVNNIPIGIE